MVRLGIGAAILIGGAAIYLPQLIYAVSSYAIINARIVTVAATIDGRVVQPPPAEGSLVNPGTTLALLENRTVDRARLDELKASRTRALGEREAAEKLAGSLRGHLDQLTKQADTYRGAASARLDRVSGERRAELDAARAAMVEAQRDFERKRQLHANGYVSDAARIQSQQALARARAEVNRASIAVERSKDEAQRAHKGVFVSQEHNDVPYSQQRTDEVRMRLAEVEAQLATGKARIAELEEQIAAETRRLAELAAADVQAPTRGIVWRPLVVQGSTVSRDAEMLTLIDCSELYVTASFGAGRFDELRYGEKAEVRVLNSSLRLTGSVVEVRAVNRTDVRERFAALMPQLGEREVMAVIRLDRPADLSGEKYCNVGRRVEVRFASFGEDVMPVRTARAAQPVVR
jgi:multidrug resistance efflux pump